MFRPVLSTLKQTSLSGKSINFGEHLSIEEADQKFKSFFSKSLKPSELHHHVNEFFRWDYFPDAELFCIFMDRCRDTDDLIFAIRINEICKFVSRFDPIHYIELMKQVEPKLKELGIPTLPQLDIYHFHLNWKKHLPFIKQKF